MIGESTALPQIAAPSGVDQVTGVLGVNSRTAD